MKKKKKDMEESWNYHSLIRCGGELDSEYKTNNKRFLNWGYASGNASKAKGPIFFCASSITVSGFSPDLSNSIIYFKKKKNESNKNKNNLKKNKPLVCTN